MAELTIPQSEYTERIRNIRAALRKRSLAALYLTNPSRILYSTGFAHISTERPLSVVIPCEGPIFLMGPYLEFDHARQACPLITEVYRYPDYPGTLHPMRHFARVLDQKGLFRAKIAIDSSEGAAGGWGYRGPPISDLMREARFSDGRDIIDDMRLVKSKDELRLLRESAKWSQVAHDMLLGELKPGASDLLIGLKASQDALAVMLGKLRGAYRQLKWGLSPVVVGFRGQVGPGSAIPHAVFTKRRIRRGDVLVSEAGVEIGGYTAELERTIIVGKPSPRTRRYFQAMRRAQSAALKEFRPRTRCGQVDEVVRRTVAKEGFEKCLRHHVGHGIGLDAHEPPWLDPGDRTVMRKGMVFSCEPGLYVPGYAGFRHSDTVEVTGDGMSFITEYPREIDELTV